MNENSPDVGVHLGQHFFKAKMGNILLPSIESMDMQIYKRYNRLHRLHTPRRFTTCNVLFSFFQFRVPSYVPFVFQVPPRSLRANPCRIVYQILWPRTSFESHEASTSWKSDAFRYSHCISQGAKRGAFPMF